MRSAHPRSRAGDGGMGGTCIVFAAASIFTNCTMDLGTGGRECGGVGLGRLGVGGCMRVAFGGRVRWSFVARSWQRMYETESEGDGLPPAATLGGA